MGTTASCLPDKKVTAEIFDTDNARSINWRNLKQHKRYDGLCGKSTSVTMTKHQTVVQKTTTQEQVPEMTENKIAKAEKLKIVTNRPVEKQILRQQQEAPCIQKPTQFKQKNLQKFHFSYPQNRKLKALPMRGRKFPEPTIMPEPLVQIISTEDKSLVKLRDKVTPRHSGDALMFSTVPEDVDFTASESTSTSESQDQSSPTEEEFVRCLNPSLSTMWGMHFKRESVPFESSQVDERNANLASQEQPSQGSNSEEKTYGEEALLDYGFEGSSALTHDNVNVSDTSFIYSAFEDGILTDYKSYKYCLLDNDGMEMNVHVKILKDLSLDLLHKAGIIPEDNPLLFGVDPCMKLQRVYDHGEDLYVVSEHDVDTTLKGILSVSGYPELPPLSKMYITAELIKKFTKLHEKGIYMGNFGSASVLLAKDGRVCLDDFLESALQKLKHQIIAGPEYRGILEWNPLATDGQRKKDIYRLGQVIGKLLVGSRFQHWLRSGEDIEMMLLAENVPKPILQIICRCLRSREETVCMDEINSLASFYFRSGDLNSGRLELQQYLNFKIVVA